MFGSRTLYGTEVAKCILETVLKCNPEILVTAGQADGVCSVAREVARVLPIPLELHYLDLARNAGKYHHRSVAVLTGADHVLIIHDGVSRGTKNEMALAKKMGIPMTYINMGKK